MTSRTVPLDEKLNDYLLSITLREPEIMAQLREETSHHRLSKMQIAPEQGQFMAWLTRLLGVKRYLEVGVFTGYSTLAVALSMPKEGRITACDVSDTFTQIARHYWEKAGVIDQIDLKLQPAIHTLKGLLEQGEAGKFDLIFIDADKPSYPEYLDLSAQLIRQGGVLAIDNIFLSGRVVEPQDTDPPGVHIMHEFNAKLKQDTRFDLSVLPIGDGLTLLRRR